MHKFLFIFSFVITTFYSKAQTNIFPTTGNVGVGVLSPQAKLQVKGTEGSNEFSPQEDILHIGGNELGANGGYAGIRIGGTSDGRYFTSIRSIKTSFYGDFWNNALTFHVVNTNTYNILREVMRMTSDGFVGIGVINPTEKLTVDGTIKANGNIKAKKVIVSQTGWPDYVFDPSYSLRSLSELESFITKNKHLPDMPSAKEVEDRGISVGDNQALLLKKIEELTLYLIEQDKKINYLMEENKKLKKHEK